MDAPERAALKLVWLIGVLFVVASILELGLYWAKCSFARPPVPVEVIPCALKLIWAVVGIVILIKARSIARWISDKLDE